jgi:hypothetical protein
MEALMAPALPAPSRRRVRRCLVNGRRPFFCDQSGACRFALHAGIDSLFRPQWFDALPIKRWIERRPERTPPPLLFTGTSIAPSDDVQPAAPSTRAAWQPDETPDFVDIGGYEIGDSTDRRSPAHDATVRAALAGIAAELAESERDERRIPWSRYVAVAGALVVITLVVRTVRHRSDHATYVAASAVTNKAHGEVVAAAPLQPRSPDTVAADMAPPAAHPRVSTPSVAKTPAAKSSPGAAAKRKASTTTKRSASSQPVIRATPTPRLPIIAVTLTPPTLRVSVARTGRLTATVMDEDGNSFDGPASFTSSNRRVAVVSSTGVVTGRRPGTAMITVTSAGKKAFAAITVYRRTSSKQ